MNTTAMNLSLRSSAMMALLAAQFLSALADNAVLIVAIAIVKSRGLGGLVPFLQEAFVVPFILLAPFVGQVADGNPKGRVMMWANLLKLAGALAMAAGVNPVVAYSLIGIGAAIYSPAKYGILSQMFAPAHLVRANGMLEGSTIAAILLGVLMGGWLADYSLTWAYAGVATAYTLAAAANLLIPRLPVESPTAEFKPGFLIRKFFRSLRQLLVDPDSRFSLFGTSVFWGSGTTLRLLLFAWVPVALGIADNQTPAKLMGVLSIGIVVGAVAAGVWITLAKVNRALIGGLLIGPIVLGMSTVSDFRTAALLMGGMGLCGGLFVVPLNALLQERGHESIGAGNALAVQNFFENVVMMCFLGAYSLTVTNGATVHQTLVSFAVLLAVAVLSIGVMRLKPAIQRITLPRG